MNAVSRLILTFVLIMACGAAVGAVLSFWSWFWPEAAFLGSVATLSALVFGVIAGLSKEGDGNAA